MDTANFVQQRRTIPGLQSLIARLLDVTLVVLGALAASQVRFEDITQSRIDTAFVAFAAAFTLVLFPVFGVYSSWRGRARLRMAGQVSLAWFVVQGCGLVLMFSLHRTDFISGLPIGWQLRVVR
jgi:FlaA1/EpsC-like NDP-sugar epimerase